MGFEEANPPSDLPKSVFGGGDLSPTVTGVGLADFRVGLGGWVGFRVLMDTPTLCEAVPFDSFSCSTFSPSLTS